MSGELLFYAWESSNYFSLRSLSFINKTPLRPHRSFTIWKPPNAFSHMFSKVYSLLPRAPCKGFGNVRERAFFFSRNCSPLRLRRGEGGKQKVRGWSGGMKDWRRKEMLITAVPCQGAVTDVPESGKHRQTSRGSSSTATRASQKPSCLLLPLDWDLIQAVEEGEPDGN